MKEQQERKRLFKNSIIILVVFFLIHLGINAFFGNDLKESIATSLEGNITYLQDENGVVQIEDVLLQDGKLTYKVSPIGPGEVWVEFGDGKSEINYETIYKVKKNGKVINLSTLNYPHYQAHLCIVLCALLSLSFMFWKNFQRANDELGYSYHSMFVCGFALWLSITTLFMAYSLLMGNSVLEIIDTIRLSGHYFMMATAPVVIVFSLLLSISNLRLIQKEGFRFVNVLGILLSILLLGGLFFGLFVDGIGYQGSYFWLRILQALYSIFTSTYSLFECLLMGAVVCGISASLKKPKLDRDYIIILGCGIREDGTLYPLLQGRVDQAIAFFREQKEKTGKEAIFIPSGGKGNDEIISEAEAMKNYLLSQGIEERLILIEDQSTNTLENMKFSKTLIEERNKEAKVAFSTTNYHVFRSGVISRQAGFYPEGMGSKTRWYFWPNAFIRGFVGVIWYKRWTILLILIPTIVFFISVNILLG
ncbi:MAG: YdcF family protein [Bacillota bacterium]|nr:YdcF family protein [Bacillota bacterium]